MKREDSIVSPTLSPYMSVDLGARSLVSGVDCNGPGKSNIRIVCSFSFLRHLDIMHHHASFTLHVFVKSKTIWNQIYFYFARMTMKPSLAISYFN
jgi:hypothetical protein